MCNTITCQSLMRGLFTLFWVIIIQVTAFGQNNNASLIWDQSVGCIQYDDDVKDPKRGIEFIEGIENAPCIRVCHGAIVNYIVQGSNIADVQWQVTGGTLLETSGAVNQHAQIEWNFFGNGAITVTITYTDQSVKTYTPCVEVIKSPRAYFTMLNENEDGVFCLNTLLIFNNLSDANAGTDIIYYNWDFGDGHHSNAFEPQHAYDQPGEYTITLTVTNQCNCTNTYKRVVRIIPRPDVLISCPAVVCETDKPIRYTASDECPGGEWSVEGGTIVEANPEQNWIEVIWHQVDEDGFGYVNYLSRCSCPFWTKVKVPVVKKEGTIKGNEIICLGKQNRFSLPQWPTTEFNWQLISDTNPTSIVLVDQRNEVVINGLQEGTYTLMCTYKNTLLGCEGFAQKKIVVLPTVEIAGEETFCSGNLQQFTNTSGSDVSWELWKDNTMLSASYSAIFEYDFPTGGSYVLSATVTGGCTSEPFIISVSQTPDTPEGSITGDSQICPGMPYSYSYTNTEPNTMLLWEVTGGVIQGENTGDQVSIVFNASGPYSVSVKRRSIDALACESQPLSLEVIQKIVNPTITNDNGMSFFCPSSVSSFTADLHGIVPDHIQWSILDNIAGGSNFGNIISGVNDSNVTVSFNEISTSPSGILRLSVTVCGQVYTFDTSISLAQLPVIEIADIGQVCPLDDNITITVNIPGVSSGTLEFDFGNGTVTGPVPVNASGIYTLQNGFSNITDANVSQTLTVKLLNPNGCNYQPTASKTAVVFPETRIDITPGYNIGICLDDPYNVTLNSSVSTGITSSVEFQWYKSGVAIDGATSSTYQLSNAAQGNTPQGSYYVMVKDINNCWVRSENILVYLFCSDEPECEIIPNPDPQITFDWNCEIITAGVTFNGTPDQIYWTGSPHLTLVDGQYTPNVSFTTDVAGAHAITVELTYGNCVVTRYFTVEKNYQSKLSTAVTCNAAAGTYDVTLFNNSTIFGIDADAITFTYTGTAIPTPVTGQSATISNLPPGTYTFTLTLSALNKPTCSVTETVVLAPMPDVNFILPATEFCAEEPIVLTIPNYDPANTYRWKFTNTSYIASGEVTEINIAAPGNPEIRLEATTPHGCSIESDIRQITINTADFDGGFQPQSISACEGANINPIVYNNVDPNAPMPNGYIWMKGNQQVGTGNTFTPSESGSYWAVLIDSNACKYYGMAENPVNVIIRKRPFVTITGNSNLCAGETTTLQGVITNNALERRWLLDGNPMAPPYGTWSTTTPLNMEVATTTAGTYTYTLEVRPVSDTDCGNSQAFPVTVNPAVASPSISYEVVSCEPYTVKLTATGPSNGTYNWSNGDNGQSIVVNNGGAYQVTYTAPTGCSANGHLTVPHATDRYMWIFPDGCFDVCPFTTPPPYIIGPWGTFTSHQWIVNGNVVQGGSNMPVQNIAVTQAGTYQLKIQNGICSYTSDLAYISPDPEVCEIPDCGLRYWIEGPKPLEDGTYVFTGEIFNGSAAPITVTLSSYNGFGTYSPGSVTIPAGTNYAFTPLIFTPNAGFNGGEDFVVLQIVGQNCMSLNPVKFLPPGMMSTVAPQTEMAVATMSVSPNPAQNLAAISYDLADEFQHAETLTVHNMSGTLLTTVKLTKEKGEILLDVSGWSSGTYMLNLQAEGKTVLQQKLVKK